MIAVQVRVEHVLDRLVRDALDLVDDVLAVVFELIVHQDHAFVGDVDGGISAVADDRVQVVGDLADRVIGLLGLLFALRRGRSLRIGDPGASQRNCARGKAYKKCPAHAGNYIKSALQLHQHPIEAALELQTRGRPAVLVRDDLGDLVPALVLA